MSGTINKLLGNAFFLNTSVLFFKVSDRLEKFLMPVIVLFMRLWMGQIFWFSGMTKLNDFDNAKYLFENLYNVPLIPPILGAYMATAFELMCPVFLVLGLATRLSVLPMLGMTAVIQFFVFPDLYKIHVFWALTLGLILCYGPGVFSIDHFLKRFYKKGEHPVIN